MRAPTARPRRAARVVLLAKAALEAAPRIAEGVARHLGGPLKGVAGQVRRFAGRPLGALLGPLQDALGAAREGLPGLVRLLLGGRRDVARGALRGLLGALVRVVHRAPLEPAAARLGVRVLVGVAASDVEGVLQAVLDGLVRAADLVAHRRGNAAHAVGRLVVRLARAVLGRVDGRVGGVLGRAQQAARLAFHVHALGAAAAQAWILGPAHRADHLIKERAGGQGTGRGLACDSGRRTGWVRTERYGDVRYCHAV